MNQEISKWLNGTQNYQEGVSLFEAFGNNPVMLRQFKNSRPISMKTYLQVALKKLLNVQNRYEARITKKEKPITIRNKVKVVRQPSEYDKVVAYRKDKFIELARLRNGIADLKTDGERARAVDKVALLEKENKKLWQVLDYFDKNKKWKNNCSPLQVSDEKPRKSKVDQDALSAKAEWEKLRKRIDRAEKSLAKLKAAEGASSPKYIKKQTDIAKLLGEKDALFKKMGK